MIAIAISQRGDEGVVPDRGGESAPPEESAGGGGAAAGEAEIALAEPGAQQLDAPAPQTADEGVARGADQRIVDATAEPTLGAEAEDVQDVANGVVEVTDRHDGIVVDSQVTTDEDGARAAFELEIPYRELDATLTDLSELGDVISPTQEASEDITARAVRAQRELAGVLDRLRDARVELIRADTREERLIARSRIDSLEATADALEAESSTSSARGASRRSGRRDVERRRLRRRRLESRRRARRRRERARGDRRRRPGQPRGARAPRPRRRDRVAGRRPPAAPASRAGARPR